MRDVVVDAAADDALGLVAVLGAPLGVLLLRRDVLNAVLARLPGTCCR